MVAASGLAREAIEVVRLTTDVGELVVLDDDPSRWGESIGDRPIVGGSELAGRHDDHAFVVCAGRGPVRRLIVERLAQQGIGRDHFMSIVHPSVHLPLGCSVGRGTVMLAGTVVTANADIGDHVVAMPNAVITHDDVVEDYVTLCAGVVLGGNVTVGRGAYLGMNAAVREGCRVGREATLGMGAVLLTDLPDGAVWAGVPARALRTQNEPTA